MCGQIASHEYVAIVSDIKQQEVELFVNNVKKDGFSKNTDLDDGSADGIFLFTAQNANGYDIEISYVDNQMTLSIYK